MLLLLFLLLSTSSLFAFFKSESLAGSAEQALPLPALPLTRTATLRSLSCGFRVPVEVEVQCQRLSFADEALSLPLVRLSLKPFEDTAPAILHLSGGPGQGGNTNEDSVHHWAEWLQENQIPFELVIIDTRANHGATGFWQCPAYEKLSVELAALPIDLRTEYSRLQSTVEACLRQYDQRLREQGIQSGLAALNSQAVAADLKGLFDSFPQREWHLWGVSYGTRLALLMAQDERVSTLVLDSIYPIGKGQISEWPGLLQASFEIHESLYRQAYGEEFSGVYERAKQALSRKSLSLKGKPWGESEEITLALTPHRLDALQFFTLYDESLIEYFHEALREIPSNSEALDYVAETFIESNFDSQFNTLLFWAVECQDNANSTEQAFRAAFPQSAYSALAEEDLLLEWQYDVCRQAIFDRSAVLSNAVIPQQPTVILAGDLDPITPSKWALAAQSQWPNARLIRDPDVGHAVLISRPCYWSALIKFWQGAEADFEQACAMELAPEL